MVFCSSSLNQYNSRCTVSPAVLGNSHTLPSSQTSNTSSLSDEPKAKRCNQKKQSALCTESAHDILCLPPLLQMNHISLFIGLLPSPYKACCNFSHPKSNSHNTPRCSLISLIPCIAEGLYSYLYLPLPIFLP